MSKIYVVAWSGYGRGYDIVEEFVGVIDNTKEARQKLLDEEICNTDWDYGSTDAFVEEGDLSDLEQENPGAEWDEASRYGYSFTLLDDKIKEVEEELEKLKSYL